MASSIAGAPSRISPVVPSTVIRSPTAKRRPSGDTIIWALRSITKSDAPTTHGRPSPRPITAAWLVTPPRMVNTAAAACIPRISSGVVSRRTSTHGSLRAALACASLAVNTIRPDAAPGLAAIPLTILSRGELGSICRCSNSDNVAGSIRITASSRGIILSTAKATAICTEARDERCTRTASRIRKILFSIVNSTCISSRNLRRHTSPSSINWLNTSGHSSSSDAPRSSLVR